MKVVLTVLIYLFLALCMLVGAANPLYLHYSYGAGLMIAALVGFAVGGIAPHKLRGWRAWLALVVPTWVGFIYVLYVFEATPFWHLGILMYTWPIVSSVGVAAGLAAWRLPERLWAWRILPATLGAAAVLGVYFWGTALIAAIPRVVPTTMHGTFRAPAFTLQLLDGGSVESAKLRGKTVVLAFWATWCEPCREELPSLEKLYDKRWRDDPRIAFYAVDVGLGGDTPAKGRAYLEKLGLHLPAAFDRNGELSRKLRTGGVLPVRVVIGPDGVVRFRKAGYDAFDAGFSALRKAVAASIHAR